MKISCPQAKVIGNICKQITYLPEGIQNSTRELILSAEFRSAKSLSDQIGVLSSKGNLTQQLIGVLLECSKSTVHRYHPNQIMKKANMLLNFQEEKKNSPNSILLIREEEQVINWIIERQKQFDCPSPNEIRKYAALLRNKRLNLERFDDILTRDWWHNFKTRYEGLIGIKYAESRESARCNVSHIAVEKYISNLLSALTTVKDPSQILNMDETGFHSRIDKGRKRKCVFFRQCESTVTFSEEKNSTTLSIICCINAAGQTLEPLFITKENIKFKSKELNEIKHLLKIAITPKGYANEESMIAWINLILKPYINNLRRFLNDENAIIYLIMDNCSVHSTMNVAQNFNAIPFFKIIWLPPNISHFLQMLDSSFFGILKQYYRNIQNVQTSPKIEGKIIRAYKAFWNASYPQNVIRSWEQAGFSYFIPNQGSWLIKLNWTTVWELIKLNCSDIEENPLFEDIS